MKKILISICALAALAACTKSEVQYEPSGEISFAPVAKTLTKSVAGYYYGAGDKYAPTDGTVGKFDGVFPTDIDLYVFANAVDGTSSTEYFKNALFEWKEGGNLNSFDPDGEGSNQAIPTTGAYAGNPPRYWPNVKTLKFIGYSAACNVAATQGTATTAAVNADFTTLTISNYTQNNTKYTAEGANDLMWFPATQAYGKQANEIPVQMKHACSWITINVAVDANMKSMKCKLNQLEALQLIHDGNVTCGETATWTFGENPSKGDETYYKNDSGVELTTTATKYEDVSNNFIVLPQTPVDLNVTYTYVSQDNTDGADLTLTETAPVSLALADNTDWQAGVHYIYNVTITATEILIDPVVVDWTTSTTPAVTLPENN